MIALFIGRFQPFHKGHLWAIKHILKDADKVIIGIGSSKSEGTATNPFSARKRREMIEDSLKSEGIRHYAIFEIPDIICDDDWAAHVSKKVPGFDVFYSGSELSRKLFSDRGIRVISLPRYRNISGCEIRLRIMKGLRWQALVPKPVEQFLQMIGAERIRRYA